MSKLYLLLEMMSHQRVTTYQGP